MVAGLAAPGRESHLLPSQQMRGGVDVALGELVGNGVEGHRRTGDELLIRAARLLNVPRVRELRLVLLARCRSLLTREPSLLGGNHGAEELDVQKRTGERAYGDDPGREGPDLSSRVEGDREGRNGQLARRAQQAREPTTRGAVPQQHEAGDARAQDTDHGSQARHEDSLTHE